MPQSTERHETGPAPAPSDAVPLSRGLSTKLLLLTILFVMLAEILIFLPSVANFRLRWLEERLATAAAVGIVLAVVGSVLGLAVGLGFFLLFKVLPVALVGYVVVRLLSPKRKALSAEDRKWLES